MNVKLLAAVAVVIIALAAVGGYMALSQDDGEADDGEASGGSDTNRVEYRLELQDNVTAYSIDIRFSAPVSGYYHFYIGDEPLRNVEGEILGESWTGVQWIHGMWWAPYEPGQHFDDIEREFNVRFSSNIDAVRVY